MIKYFILNEIKLFIILFLFYNYIFEQFIFKLFIFKLFIFIYIDFNLNL